MARPAAPVDGDATRVAIVQAAHDLLAQEGATALTVRRLAAAAGMSTMNIYSRFGGKDGVVEELFVDGFERLAAAMDGAGETDDVMADLQRCGAAYRDFALTNRTYYEVMFDRAVPGYEPTEAARHTAAATLVALAHKLERAMDAGMLVRAEPFDVAVSVWATCHGLVSLELKSAAPPGVDWASTYRRTVDALVRGLATAERPAAGTARA